MPPPAVRLENRALSLEREVEPVRAAVPLEWQLACETGQAARDEEAPGLHFQRGTGRVRGIELAEGGAHGRDARPSCLSEPDEVGAQRRDRREPAATRILACDFE